MSVDIATLGVRVDSSEVRTAGRDLDNLADRGKRAEGATKGVASAASDLRSALAVLGIGKVASELGQMADTYKSINGRLALVTSGTAELNAVSEKLFNVAQRTRQEFEGVADLYGSLARSTKALGVSQGDLLQVTETINQALIVSGASASSAQAALAQLGQGFASGTLRGDELNSVLEQTPRLAQAIADGMGVTVGQLRALGAEGKITGETVFNALKSQRETVEREFANMPVTISQSFTQLRNEILKYVGEADAASGASASFAAGIQSLAKNLDAAVQVIEVLAVAYGIKLTAGFVTSTAAAIAEEAALLGLTSAAEVAGFAVGTLVARLAALTVLGTVAFAIVGVVSETAKMNAAMTETHRQFEEFKKKAEGAAAGASSAGGGAKGLGTDALGSIPKIDAFGGRVGAAAQQLYNMARAARAARVEMLSTQLAQSQEKEVMYGNATPGGRSAIAADNRAALLRGDILGIDPSVAYNRARSFFSGGRTDRENEKAFSEQISNSKNIQRELDKAKADPIGANDLPTVSGGGGGATGGRKGGGGGGGGAKSEADRQVEDSKNYLASLTKETEGIGLNELALHRLEVTRAAAKAPTEALKTSILAAGQAWETATIAANDNKTAMEQMKKAQDDARRANEQQLKDGAAMADAIAYETQLQGMNAKERAIANAQREMEQRGIVAGTEAYIKYAAAILKAAENKGELQLQADNADSAAATMSRLTDSVNSAANAFGDLFEGTGKGFAELVTTLADYYDFQTEQEAKLADVRARYGDASQEYLRAEADARAANSENELETYGKVLSGVKSLFSQKSAAYKVMEGVEKAYAAVRLALAIKEILTEGILTTAKVGGAGARMATDAAETATSVAHSGIRAAADGVAAFAKTLASLPFPLNLVAGAAVLAALVAVGVKVAGGGGKKSATADLTADSGTSTTAAYPGPFDEYGQPTSSYSVLRPGRTTAGANDNGGINVGTSSAAGASSITNAPTYHINIEGNADEQTVQQLRQALTQTEDRAVERARAAAAGDRAVSAGRQRIGGAG